MSYLSQVAQERALSRREFLSGAALLPFVAFDFNPLHLRSPKTESVSTLYALMADADSTPDTLEVVQPNLTAAPRRVLYLTYNLASHGDHRARYYADKYLAYPPDIERIEGKKYVFRV